MQDQNVKKKSMLSEGGNTFDTFVRPSGCTHRVLARNTERKQDMQSAENGHEVSEYDSSPVQRQLTTKRRKPSDLKSQFGLV